MPMYEYACRACGERFEKLVKTFDAPASVECPACQSYETSRELSTFAVGAESSGRSVPVATGCGRCGGPGPCAMGN